MKRMTKKDLRLFFSDFDGDDFIRIDDDVNSEEIDETDEKFESYI